jgi:tRNA U34 2-thiouridine synthase MnmA/TrmU
MLAIRIMQEQGIDVEALNFKTVFTCCQDQSAQKARELGVRLTVVGQDDDYLDLVKEPRFGRGKGANPCVDCRIYMFEKAKRFMHQIGADFIVSGEVAGQRPMSQKRRDLDRIAYHADLEDLLLRPLSAKLLRPTLPEREGWVDREKLYGFDGRGRKRLIALAKKYGLKDIPSPSTGCSLTEPKFATKVVLGRDEAENERLHYAHRLPDAASTAWLVPDNFLGPQALLIGPRTDAAIDFAASLMLRYSRDYDPANALVRVDDQIINAAENERTKTQVTIAVT